jgi:hypothetical protein
MPTNTPPAPSVYARKTPHPTPCEVSVHPRPHHDVLLVGAERFELPTLCSQSRSENCKRQQ